jgi:hypothetical protein
VSASRRGGVSASSASTCSIVSDLLGTCCHLSAQTRAIPLTTDATDIRTPYHDDG